MKVVAICGAGVALAALATACGGGQRDRQITARNAVRIANVAPAAAGWVWPHNTAKPEWSASDKSSPASADPLVTEFRRKTANLADVGDAHKRWQDDDKLANLDVGVYGSASDAHQAMAPFDEFSRKEGEKTGRVVDARRIEGFGDEAWRLLVAGDGPEVTYHVRRGNVLVEAHIHCFGSCPPDIDAAAQAWIRAIDNAAKA